MGNTTPGGEGRGGHFVAAVAAVSAALPLRISSTLRPVYLDAASIGSPSLYGDAEPAGASIWRLTLHSLPQNAMPIFQRGFDLSSSAPYLIRSIWLSAISQSLSKALCESLLLNSKMQFMPFLSIQMSYLPFPDSLLEANLRTTPLSNEESMPKTKTWYAFSRAPAQS
jgi:hypothetical protein